ncbi:MAG: purine-nucleoside phosphorylase [Bacillota bacterium]|nr:purine-nucleoside phosphorylase [Bacillota bacterium]
MSKFIPDLICAEEGAIAETVLLPGDPLRAKYLAETYLENAVLYNEARGMYGYTGYYKGTRVSVQGSGMGTSCIMECVHQLVEDYGCKNLIRIGTCGSSSLDVHVGDTLISTASASVSNNTVQEFGNYDFIPTGSFELIKLAYDCSKELGIPVHIGPTTCTDALYMERDKMPEFAVDPMKGYNFIGGEMEGTGLFVAASHYKHVRAALLITCSDHQVYTHEDTPLAERENSYNNMMKIALEVACKIDREGK